MVGHIAGVPRRWAAVRRPGGIGYTLGAWAVEAIKRRPGRADNRAMLTRPVRPFAALLALSLAVAVAIPARAAEFKIRGLLDVVAAPRGEAFDGNLLIRGDSPLDAYGLRLFGETQANDKLQVFMQVVMRDATTPYVDGAYALFTPSPARDLHLLAGKVPWPIGTWAPRTYSNKNPLIGAPLMYQYHSTLLWYEVVPSADALLATSGSGQYGVNYFGYREGRGMTLVDDSYWDVGATLVGSERPFEYALGVGTGTPGWGTTSQEENGGKSLLGRVGLAPLPGVRFGVSAAYGQYLIERLESRLPPGARIGDFHQKLALADLELLYGHAELRAEGAHNVWETPTVGDLRVRSGYAELKYALPFGAFVAGRYDVMRFGRILDSGGQLRPWDSDLSRIETGVGYRFSRDALAKLVYQRTSYDVSPNPAVPADRDLVAGQLSFAF
jgi:hypothetical protein